VYGRVAGAEQRLARDRAKKGMGRRRGGRRQTAAARARSARRRRARLELSGASTPRSSRIRLQARQPAPVVAVAEVRHRIESLEPVPARVDVAAEPATREQRHPEDARLQRPWKTARGARSRRVEAVHAAHVVDAVHEEVLAQQTPGTARGHARRPFGR
jgi:hypothetical protein